MDPLIGLIAICAPAIDPVTAHALVLQESGGNPYAIHVNGSRRQPRAFSEAQAVSIARAYVDAGYSVDMGYAQINSGEIHRLGITVAQVFEPCVNLAAMQTMLTENYLRAAGEYGPGQRALGAALSTYNTGNNARGFGNGYIGALVQQVRRFRGTRDLH